MYIPLIQNTHLVVLSDKLDNNKPNLTIPEPSRFCWLYEMDNFFAAKRFYGLERTDIHG